MFCVGHFVILWVTKGKMLMLRQFSLMSMNHISFRNCEACQSISATYDRECVSKLVCDWLRVGERSGLFERSGDECIKEMLVVCVHFFEATVFIILALAKAHRSMCSNDKYRKRKPSWTPHSSSFREATILKAVTIPGRPAQVVHLWETLAYVQPWISL